MALVTAVFLTIAALAPVGASAIAFSSLLFPPKLERIPDPRPPGGSQLSRVFDVHGEEIAVFREFDQRLPVEQGDIPEVLKQAVISMEDQSFYSNSGVDISGSLRALIANVRGQEVVQGGSTITQQYVKNAYVGTERTIERKIKEAILARQLDRLVDKEEILFKYLNAIYLGEGTIGVGAASRSYFRKPVNELNLSESALLAGLIPAPSRYEPRNNPEAAEDRRVVALDTMLDEGYITPDQHEEAAAQRVWLTTKGPAPRNATLVYPAQDEVTEYPYFVDYVRRYLESQYGQAVYAGGLEIRTTLDPRIQLLAEQAVTEALEGTEPPIEMALASVEPQSGFLKAMVGGRDFSAPDGQVNLALGDCAEPSDEVRSQVDVAASCWNRDNVVVEGGGTGRQPGSSWKPFVLATALDQGIGESKVYSAPGTYRIPNCTGSVGCTVNNYEGSSGGRVSLRTATVKSFNTVYAQVINDVGVPEVAAMAKQLGITSAWVASPEVHGTSYALGAQEVSPLDMASAYGVFATNGLRNPPTPVLWVKDANGEFVEDNREREAERVLDANVAYTVTDILKGVISGGTGTAADIGRPAAGKTGTAQEWRDAWFIGYTPALSTAVWIGDKTRPTSLFDIKGVARVTGGSIPAETWKAFMTEALADVPPDDFVEPPPPPPPPPSPTTVPTGNPATTAPPPPTTTTVPPTTTTRRPFVPPPDLTTTTTPIVPRNPSPDSGGQTPSPPVTGPSDNTTPTIRPRNPS
ncbi:MAG: transglycosylase domain-containing protein [Acidimicrobiales bacterium]